MQAADDGHVRVITRQSAKQGGDGAQGGQHPMEMDAGANVERIEGVHV